jgi:phage shock protein C
MAGDYKRLYRSGQERMLLGVCGGIGEYFSVDPTLVRAIFVALALVGGGGLLLYIILAVVIPLEPESGAVAEVEEAQAEAEQGEEST